MKYCYVEQIKEAEQIWFVVCETDSMNILLEPTKYLKHKTREHCSPNTVKKIAYAISYYLCFLKECGYGIEQVLQMKYANQQEHFVRFLYWLKEGKHSERKKKPNNATCNSYLQEIFGYYEFVLLEYENAGDVKVLESRDISYNGVAGVRFQRSIKIFRGYLPEEKSVGKTIEEKNIKKLLNASDSIRNKLLILLLAETGFRIGEVLGIRYTEDIDYENHTIKVIFREDNENYARAKNAEIRRAKISNETFDILMFYIAENRKMLNKTKYLFITLSGNTKGQPLTANAVYSVFRLLKKKTGIAVTPHMLRHYYANERRKVGWSLDKISKALGHKQLATTESYMNIEDEEMTDIMEQYYKENQGLYDINRLL